MILYVLATVHPAMTATGDAQAGKAIYERSCVGCHGPTGQGGRMAAMLAVPPRNLADQAYMGTRSDQQLFDVISKGGAATGLSAAMTAFEVNSVSNRSGIPWHTSATWLLARKLLHRFRVAHRRRPAHLLPTWSWHVCGSPFGPSMMTHGSSSCCAVR